VVSDVLAVADPTNLHALDEIRSNLMSIGSLLSRHKLQAAVTKAIDQAEAIMPT